MRSTPLVQLLALAATGLFLAACPPANTLPPDAGPADYVGRSCNVDAECGALRCDKVRHQCICLSDESCKSSDIFAPPRYCNNYTGLCVTEIAGCTNDTQCGDTEWCDPSIRACRPLKGFCETCEGNNECGGADDDCILDETLNQRFCGHACASNTDCARGAICKDINGKKSCWPDKTPAGDPATCENYKGCVPDSLRTCAASADCGDASQRCDPAQGKCVAVQQVCPFGTTCDPRQKVCVADCAADADCGDPLLRCVNRVCEPVNECTTDTECPDNKVCGKAPGETTGQCIPFCQADTDCPLGQICTQVGSRYTCLPGCSNNQGCPLDQRCNAQNQCEGPTVNGKRICQATNACNTCELCDGVTNECGSAKTGTQGYPYCQPCSSPSECSGGSCVTLGDGNGYCAKFCGIGQECPQGFACLGLSTGGSACVPADRSCTGKCP